MPVSPELPVEDPLSDIDNAHAQIRAYLEKGQLAYSQATAINELFGEDEAASNFTR